MVTAAGLELPKTIPNVVQPASIGLDQVPLFKTLPAGASAGEAAHKARVDGVDAHALAGVLLGEGLGQVVLRGLADVVRRRVHVDLDRAQAADVDHSPVLHACQESVSQLPCALQAGQATTAPLGMTHARSLSASYVVCSRLVL